MEVIGTIFGKLIGGIIGIFVNIIAIIFGKGVVPLLKGIFNAVPWWGKLIIVIIIISLLINIIEPIFRFSKDTYIIQNMRVLVIKNSFLIGTSKGAYFFIG